MTCLGFLFVFSCHAAGAVPPPADFCAIYNPIRWSSADTRQTKEQVDRNNRKWKALCKGK